MTKKIFRSTLLVVSAVLILSIVIVTGVLYDHFSQIITNQLRSELDIVKKGIVLSGTDYLQELYDTKNRITLLSPEGIIIFDSIADESTMPDHSDREEISQAISLGKGSSIRYSDTLKQRMIYCAEKLSDGSILRISASMASIFVLLKSVLRPIMHIALCGILISAILASTMARSIVKPLNELDLEKPAENMIYDELSPILRKMNQQHIRIEEQMNLLKEKADELDQITYSMSEGLIILGKDKRVKRMNPAARKIYDADRSVVGYDFSVVDRSLAMTKAVEDALNGKHSEFRENRDGREFQFLINSIAYSGGISGCLILCFDVTEMANAERNRREFTANVSHELKTPMQSIIGSAELLQSGLVRAEDEDMFISNIKNEATRLVDLINDIIRLSQLDENSQIAAEKVDLYEVANEVVDILQPSADKKGVKLIVKGQSACISGVRRYLYEIIYNLCDNAIRYNKENGEVVISISSTPENTVLSVCDTGIGIPASHQPRIFERFYRVDKSHSKETGGTGLGLSIVKHAVMYHKGTIRLESTPGEGTTITITF